MKICRWLIEGFLFVLLIVGGCFAKPPASGVTTASKVEQILNDTADDLELGAKVRAIVEKQELCKPCVHQRMHQHEVTEEKPNVLYSLNSIIFGMTFVIWVAILLDVIGRSDESKNKKMAA